jgi:hypothetical protein
VFELLLDEPHRLRGNEINDLGEGLWELKIGKVRIPFFEGNCTGTGSSMGAIPKLGLPTNVQPPTTGSHCARMTHAFEKGTEKTPRREIDRAEGIRREDFHS